MDSDPIGTAIREAMAASGRSRLAMAEATGIPRATLYRSLDGHRPFTTTELVRVAAFLDVPLASLVKAAA